MAEKYEAFVEKDGKACWRCGWCHAVHEEMSSKGGAYVKVANVLVAIVCADQCLEPAQAAVVGLFQPIPAVPAGRVEPPRQASGEAGGS